MNNLLLLVFSCAAILLVAYLTYGRLLTRLFRLDRAAATPAETMRDDVDYMPTDRHALLSQHFSAIAAAGPIVGPILAGAMFGWMPALLWILIGAVFIGGVHDMGALTASVRHKAQSIAEVVRGHISRRSAVLFLTFVWLALIYIIVAFTDITASSFVGVQTLEDGSTVSGGGIATSSLLYLALPIVMGLLLRYTRLSLGWATVIFVPLVGVAIWAGQLIPFDVAAIVQSISPELSAAEAQQAAHKVWDVALLVYCVIASLVPLWLLLQPRGHLGGYFLYIALLGGALGLIVSGQSIEFPAFTGWTAPNGSMLFPVLFITIACGACSGFHALIASGTTSKQLSRETDARVIGYGAMLLEGMVAVVSLCCVIILAPGSPLLADPKPNYIYAQGIGTFLGTLGIPTEFAVSFALMAFTTFVYDTLDVCTRLGRFIIQEVTGWKGAAGRWMGTLLTAGVAMYFTLQTVIDPTTGKPVPIWRSFWYLFGASNQLLAALALLGVTVWLWRTRRAWWVWLVTGVPMAWMYVMSTWALALIVAEYDFDQLVRSPVAWVAIVLIVLALAMLADAVVALFGVQPPRKETATAEAVGSP